MSYANPAMSVCGAVVNAVGLTTWLCLSVLSGAFVDAEDRKHGVQPSQQGDTCWQVVDGESGRVVTCAMYPAAEHAIELRIGNGPDVLRSEFAANVEAARALAQKWLARARIDGSFAAFAAPIMTEAETERDV